MNTLTPPPATTRLRIDGDRLWASLMELAAIGATADAVKETLP